MNSPASSLAGELTRLRLMALHSQRMTMESPVTDPTSEASRHGCNLIAHVLPLMAERAIKFSIPSGWGAIEKGTVGISSLFENWVKFQPHCQRLRSHGLVALEQLLSPDCKVLLSWRELCCLVPSLTYTVPH